MRYPLAALALLAAPAAAQLDVRPLAVLQSDSAGVGAKLATAADLTVALLRDGNDHDLSLRASDGRGLEWSTALDVDPVDDGVSNVFEQVDVLGDQAFVLWSDQRFYDPSLWPATSRLPYLRVYDSATHTLGPETPLPIVGAPTTTGTSDLELAVEEVGGVVRVHVASLEVEFNASTNQNEKRVVVYSSYDEGATWPQRVVVTPAPDDQFNQLRLCVSGDDVHVFWIGGNPFVGHTVSHALSVDGGQTFGAPNVIPGVRANVGYDVDVDGALIALAWHDFEFDFVYEWVQCMTSPDKGATWLPQTGVVGDGTYFFGQSFTPDIAIRPGTTDVTMVAGGYDEFTPASGIVRLHSADGGVTWLPQTVLYVGTSIFPRLTVAGDGRASLTVTWTGTGGANLVRHSHDGGATFEADTTPLNAGYQSGRPVWNDRYQNYLTPLTQIGAPNELAVGGLRLQDIDLTGFTGGSTSLQVDFANMTGGADLALFVVSSVEGALALPAPDGRITGLGASPLLNATLGLATSGVFLAPITNGAGTNGPIPTLPLQPGLTAYGLGLSIDLATGAFVDLTDVMRIDT